MLTDIEQKWIGAAVLARIATVRAVYLFGSAIDESMRLDSDIDIAILNSTLISAHDGWALKRDVSAHFHRDVDIVDLLNADAVTRSQVVAFGLQILCQDAFFAAMFETTALADYAILNEERREILEDISTKGSIRGG